MPSPDKALAMTRHAETFHAWGVRSAPYRNTYDAVTAADIPVDDVSTPVRFGVWSDAGSLLFLDSATVVMGAPSLPQLNSNFNGLRFELVYSYILLVAPATITITPLINQAVFGGVAPAITPPTGRVITASTLGAFSPNAFREYADPPYIFEDPPKPLTRVTTLAGFKIDVSYGAPGGRIRIGMINVEVL